MYRCKHSRRIWIRIVDESADGERIHFGEDELTLCADKGPQRAAQVPNPKPRLGAVMSGRLRGLWYRHKLDGVIPGAVKAIVAGIGALVALPYLCAREALNGKLSRKQRLAYAAFAVALVAAAAWGWTHTHESDDCNRSAGLRYSDC
jgi:hypothetical protein